jgi:hypothetical protein
MDTVVVIEGSHFGENPKAVVIGGRQCPICLSQATNDGSSGSLLTRLIPPAPEPIEEIKTRLGAAGSSIGQAEIVRRRLLAYAETG